MLPALPRRNAQHRLLFLAHDEHAAELAPATREAGRAPCQQGTSTTSVMWSKVYTTALRSISVELAPWLEASMGQQPAAVSYHSGSLHRQPGADGSHCAPRNIYFFFSRKTKTSPWWGKLWRAQQMRPLDWLSHTAFPFYFQAFSIPKAICHRGITHTSRKYLGMYVCIYICMCVYIYVCAYTHTL